MFGIEIIPNWHPIFVHFTVGVLSVAVMLHAGAFVLKNPTMLLVGRWNLWIGTAFTVLTVATGLLAYYTVAHDGPSHEAMTLHRNWALGTAAFFALLTLWSLWRHRGAKRVHPLFLLLLMIGGGLVGLTGYLGAEVVYRHGIGVISLPEIHGDGGHGTHEHRAGTGHHEEMMEDDHHEEMDAHHEEMIEDAPHDHSTHEH